MPSIADALTMRGMPRVVQYDLPAIPCGPSVETRRVDVPGVTRYVVFVGGEWAGQFSARVVPYHRDGKQRVEPFRVSGARKEFMGFADTLSAAVALLVEE